MNGSPVSWKSVGILSLLLAMGSCAMTSKDPGDDPYLWLENVGSDASLDWVETQNRRTFDVLESDPRFDGLYEDALAALNAASRVPAIVERGGYLYNFWQDSAHPRGIYRRTTLASFRAAKPDWETVLDIDALSNSEGQSWVFKGVTCLDDDPGRCLVYLSPGGGDASETREFDMARLQFVDNGFRLPAAKARRDWIDADHLFVATDFGEGSMTSSGYPRILKRWQRGTPLSSATTLFTASPDVVSVSGTHLAMDEGSINLVIESVTFWRSNYYLLDADDNVSRLAVPETASLEGGYRGQLVFSLHEDWRRGDATLLAGSVVVGTPQAFADGGALEVLVVPQGNEVVEAVRTSSHGILVTKLIDVQSRVDLYQEMDSAWTLRALPLPAQGDINVRDVVKDSGDVYATFESFLTPPGLYRIRISDMQVERLKSQAATFDASPYVVKQWWTTSADGTRVPYFVVGPEEPGGPRPVHIFSYGGFRNALTPSYSGSYESLSGAYGNLWLARGGVFVLANIRGGGEFGPAWHTAALRENKVRSYEDFEAIAEDLVARGVTTHDRIGIEGRSNGGLLVTATMTRRPELYGAIICGVPLADMKRYHRLLAGASWMAEYGDPDVPSDWAFMRDWSPYQNLAPDADYPAVFFFTSTRDDRVHPGHARKMMARMRAQGHEAWYYENTEGGHGGSATNEQLARRIALGYTHLWRELGR